MARSYPEIAPIPELRYNLSQLKLSELAAGQRQEQVFVITVCQQDRKKSTLEQ